MPSSLAGPGDLNRQPAVEEATVLLQTSSMNDKPQDYYRVFALGVPNVRVMSEGLTRAEAQSRKREILMAYPSATVRIEKTDESGKRR